MPAGWRTTIVEHWPDEYEYGRRKAPGQVSVVQALAPWQPNPSQAQLDQLEQVYARYGGVAHATVIGKFWFGYPVLTPEQQRALAGLP